MSSLILGRDTVYKQYVRDRVGQGLKDNPQLYNYDDLAEMVGLKPTHNFKRRIREMVSEGLLKAHVVFSRRGGLTHMFSTPNYEQTELPF
jgi:hypothetical protein